jgi:hypothetical protein
MLTWINTGPTISPVRRLEKLGLPIIGDQECPPILAVHEIDLCDILGFQVHICRHLLPARITLVAIFIALLIPSW